jgi:hypothetical protein
VNRRQKYEQTDKAKARKKAYRAKTGKTTTTAKYLAKPFIAIGGLAVRLENDQERYIHLQLSTGEQITNIDGLSSAKIYNFIMANTPETKDGILVCYGSAWDWNYWLEALNLEQLKTIYDSNYRSKPVDLDFHRLRVNPGQSFTIYDIWGEQRTINEIQNFFQVPLPEAAKEYLNINLPELSQYDKAVTLDQLEAGIKNLQQELQSTAELMTEFRQRLERINLRPRRWCGSGSITSNLFQRHNIKNHMANHPEDIAEIARYAYAGGRFEIIQYGHVNKTSYAYDINSAYPEALTKLPSLAGGRWHSIAGDPGDTEYGLYLVKTKGKKSHLPQPLFNRDKNGSIHYPREAYGWYWSPEIKTLRKWAELGFGTYEIEEALIFEPATDYKPFNWIADLYEQRLKLQQAGDGAEVGLKLALNTAYGKLAQQIGYMPADDKNAESIPPYHQLDWAGYVTSYTRAKIFEAGLEQIHTVIAFETDCIYMEAELYKIPVGDNLGEFRETKYKELTYINSGIYMGIKENGEQVYKLRGIQPGTLKLEEIQEKLKLPEPGRIIQVQQRRFITAAQIVNFSSLDHWRKWQIQTIDLKLYPVGKRVHYLCSCTPEITDNLFIGGFHSTIPAKGYKSMNQYSVIWINPDEAQQQTRRTALLDKQALI